MLYFQFSDQRTKNSTRNILSLVLSLLVIVGFIGCSDQMPTNANEKDHVSNDALEEWASSHGNSEIATAMADLRPINDSGVTGKVMIVDDGNTIEVTGVDAKGLDPDNAIDFSVPQGYLSLFYDKASPVNGPEACEPGVHSEDHPLFITGAQMFAAIWTVAEDGTGAPVDLTPADGASYVPVDKVGTMSIRDLRINGGFGHAAVVACGKVTHSPEGPPL